MAHARPPLSVVPLMSERLTLTPLDPAADAPDLHAMLSDPLVHRYDIAAQASDSVAETERRLRLQVVANGGTSWAIRIAGGPAIGTIGVFADQGTRIRGVGWSLTRTYWGQGIMREAARTAVPYLLGQDGVDGVEAWIDSRNGPSIGVARAAGMAERGRLPRVQGKDLAHTVVMARDAVEVQTEVLGAVAQLQVVNLPETVRLLQAVLRLHLAWAVPEPPTVAFLAIEPWSGSAGFQVVQTQEPIVPTTLSFDLAVVVDVVLERVVAAGLEVVEAPVDRPWYRREMSFRLAEGHVISLSGPTRHAEPPGS